MVRASWPVAGVRPLPFGWRRHILIQATYLTTAWSFDGYGNTVEEATYAVLMARRMHEEKDNPSDPELAVGFDWMSNVEYRLVKESVLFSAGEGFFNNTRIFSPVPGAPLGTYPDKANAHKVLELRNRFWAGGHKCLGHYPLLEGQGNLNKERYQSDWEYANSIRLAWFDFLADIRWGREIEESLAEQATLFDPEVKEPR